MASCKQSVNDAITNETIDQLPILYPFTNFNISISLGNSKLFRLNIAQYQELKVFTTITNNVPQFSFKIEIYDFSDNGSIVGTANISSINNVFSLNLFAGVYGICFSTVSPMLNILVHTEYEAFPFIPQIEADAYFGASLSYSFYEPQRPPKPCPDGLYVDIIEGSLPEGITMNAMGRIEGRLPNLDCVESTRTLSPSNNWLFQDGSQYYPWGRQYRFKVKAYIDSDKATALPIDHWFCIRVFNNWDFDRDHFMAQFPFSRIDKLEVITLPKPLPKSICGTCEPDTQYNIPTVQEINNSLKQVAQDNDLIVELIEIPKQINNIDIEKIPDWWQKVTENENHCCKEVRDFFENARKSNIFNKFINNQNDDEINGIAIYENFIQLTELIIEPAPVTMVDRINEARTIVNFSLPLNAQSHFGSELQYEITFRK